MTKVPSVALTIVQMTTTVAPSVVLIKSRDESRYEIQHIMAVIAPSVVLLKSRDESRYEIHDNKIVSV